MEDIFDGKEVKTQVKEVKNNFELDIVNLLKKGLNPSKISTHLNISMPNLSYYLSLLKKQGVIEKIGYGVWKVIPSGEVKILSHKGSLQVKDVRGHAFIWKIKPNKKFNWIELLKEKKIEYVPKGIKQTPRIILNNKKVWLGQNYITIFEPEWNSSFAINPIESKKQAIFDMLDTIKLIQEITGEFKYNFTCKRQHYGFVNNKEAMFFERKGQKILIKNEKGYWFSIDYSQNKYKEAETIHEKDADIDGMGYQRLMNSHEKTNFQVTPTFLLEALNKITENQVNNEIQVQKFTEQIKSHLLLIQEYRKENISWRKNTEKKIREEIKHGKQTRIGDFL
jgi:DNA-binding transcriptional ArsR family regulator